MTRRVRSHGLSYTPEYRAWQTMRLRCTNPKNAAWPNYGGRGITVCAAWLDDPTQFYRDMGPKPSPKHELDRINNDGPYCPENCRWVSRKVNDRNRRSNRRLTHNGASRTCAEWADLTGLSRTLIHYRLRAGWNAARTLTTPPRAKASKGCGKAKRRHPCADCSKPIALTNQRCIACSNKSRARAAA